MAELQIRGNCSQLVLGHLKQAKEKPSLTRLACFEVDFDEPLLEALKDLLTNDSTSGGRKWERIHFRRCSGPICDAMAKSDIAEFDFFDLDENPSPTKFHILSNSSLLRVSFENLRLSNEDAICLRNGLAVNTTLQSFGLNESYLDLEACQTIAGGLSQNKTLRALKLSDCDICDQGIVAIVNAFRNNTSLRHLSLQGNCCREEGLASIANLLNQGRLLEIDLSDQNFEDETEKLDITPLLDVLGENRSLETLTIRECNLSNEDLMRLSKILCSEHQFHHHHHGLRNVDLQWNCFSPEALKSCFAARLSDMHRLRHIQLRQGRDVLHEDVRDAIVEGLRQNMALESIDIFGWDGAVEHFCGLNQMNRSIVMRKTEFPLKLWPRFLDRAQRSIEIPTAQEFQVGQSRRSMKRKASALYYFLRNGPLLLER